MSVDADPWILLPNRYAEALRMWFVSCPCGASPGQRNGFLADHFPSFGVDGRCRLTDPCWPGTALCRYSGRSVTLDAALSRDGQLTDLERRVRGWVLESLRG